MNLLEERYLMGDFSTFSEHERTHHSESATKEQPPPPPNKARKRNKGDVYSYHILEVHTLSLSMVSGKNKNELLVAEKENHFPIKKKGTVYYVLTRGQVNSD